MQLCIAIHVRPVGQIKPGLKGSQQLPSSSRRRIVLCQTQGLGQGGKVESGLWQLSRCLI